MNLKLGSNAWWIKKQINGGGWDGVGGKFLFNLSLKSADEK